MALLIKKFPALYAVGRFITFFFFKQPVTWPCPEPDNPTLHSPKHIFFSVHLNIILVFIPQRFKLSVSYTIQD